MKRKRFIGWEPWVRNLGSEAEERQRKYERVQLISRARRGLAYLTNSRPLNINLSRYLGVPRKMIGGWQNMYVRLPKEYEDALVILAGLCTKIEELKHEAYLKLQEVEVE